MRKNEPLAEYRAFVDGRTSAESKEFDAYIASLKNLHESGCDIARLDTGITGLSAEANEMMEVIKKLKFQGKAWDTDVHFHLKREMGDVIFYWIMTAIALGIDPSDIIDENIRKLTARYPNGFEVHKSENRADGDI